MGRSHKQDLDRASIEELAATLESKIGSDDLERAGDAVVALAEPGAPGRTKEGGAPSLAPVLVAHADPGVRSALRSALERHFQVREATDGEDAWETLAAHRDIRLLITGTQLPRLDGVELIRRLRRPNGPSHLVGLPVMVYADREDPATKQTVLLAGANDYLLPDTEPEALVARVQARNRLLEQSRRAMNLTGTMPTARAGRAEASGVAAAPRADRGETRRGSFERPIWVEARGAAKSVPAGPRSWAERLYRISSTTTITLTATVLVVLAITLILLLNQTPRRPQSLAVGRLDVAPSPAAEQTMGPAEAPVEEAKPLETPPAPAETMREAGAAPQPAPKPGLAERGSPGAATGSEPGGTDRPATTTSRTERSDAEEARHRAGRETRAQTPRAPAEGTIARSTHLTQPPAAAPSREETSKPPAREAPPSPKVDEAKSAAGGLQPTPAPKDAIRAAPREDAARPQNRTETTVKSPPVPSPPATADANAPPETSVPATPPVAASPPPRPAPPRLSRDELSTLLQRFVYVYEAGDIEQFMALLADNVQTNDRVTRQAVREDYARLFRTTDLRQMRIETMNWDVEDDQAHGWGEFEVRVRRQGDATVHHYQGSITVQVRKTGGRPRIERLYHSERRASR